MDAIPLWMRLAYTGFLTVLVPAGKRVRRRTRHEAMETHSRMMNVPGTRCAVRLGR
jgi:hypothetical protein